ncbi:hypothetical protein GCM10017687_12250 [Streptomyces echinatus]
MTWRSRDVAAGVEEETAREVDRRALRRITGTEQGDGGTGREEGTADDESGRRDGVESAQPADGDGIRTDLTAPRRAGRSDGERSAPPRDP